MSGYWSWLREKGARSWGFCPPPFFSLVNRRLCAGWEREACEQPAPFRRERHAHIDPANKRAHTQNSSTPTLTPAGEDIANTIAESKPRQRRSTTEPPRKPYICCIVLRNCKESSLGNVLSSRTRRNASTFPSWRNGLAICNLGFKQLRTEPPAVETLSHWSGTIPSR